MMEYNIENEEGMLIQGKGNCCSKLKKGKLKRPGRQKRKFGNKKTRNNIPEISEISKVSKFSLCHISIFILIFFINVFS